jgi:hypothetical protein
MVYEWDSTNGIGEPPQRVHFNVSRGVDTDSTSTTQSGVRARRAAARQTVSMLRGVLIILTVDVDVCTNMPHSLPNGQGCFSDVARVASYLGAYAARSVG